MIIERNAGVVETTSWPRFGVGECTGTVYFQTREGAKWVAMEKNQQDCTACAAIIPFAVGESVTFTQE